MPKAMHEALKRTARKRGMKGKRAARYVHGTMAKTKKRAHDKLMRSAY